MVETTTLRYSAQTELQRFVKTQLLKGCSDNASVVYSVILWLEERLLTGWNPTIDGVRVDQIIASKCARVEIITIEDMDEKNTETATAFLPWALSGPVEMSPQLYGAIRDENVTQINRIIKSSIVEHLRFRRGCSSALKQQINNPKMAACSKYEASTPAELLGRLYCWNRLLFKQCVERTATEFKQLGKQLLELQADSEQVVKLNLTREKSIFADDESAEELIRDLETKRMTFVVPSAPLLQGFRDSEELTVYDAVASLALAWRSHKPLELAFGSIAKVMRFTRDPTRHNLLSKAIVFRTRKTLEDLCTRLLLTRPSTNLDTIVVCQTKAAAAVACPDYTGSWIEAVLPLVFESTVSKALFREHTSGQLLDDDGGYRSKTQVQLLSFANRTACGLNELFSKGLRRSLELSSAVECCVCAKLSDPIAAIVALCAVDKVGALMSKRVREALSEAIVHYGIDHQKMLEPIPGVCVTERSCRRAAKALCDQVDFQSLCTGAIKVADAAQNIIYLSCATSQFWSWRPVWESTVIAFKFAMENKAHFIGSEQVIIEKNAEECVNKTSSILLSVSDRPVAELQEYGLSVPPKTCIFTGEIRAPIMCRALDTLCSLLGVEKASNLIVQCQHIQRRRPVFNFKRFSDSETASPGSFATHCSRSSLQFICNQVHRSRARSLERCLFLRAIAIRLLAGERSSSSEIKAYILSPQWDQYENLTAPAFGASVLQRLLWLTTAIVPECEGQDLLVRGLRLISRGWLETTPHTPRLLQIHTQGLFKEDPIVPPILSDTLEILQSKTLQSVAETLRSKDLETLVSIHNDLDRSCTEVRRRLVSQTILMRAFNTHPQCSELAAFVLARGGLDPETSISMVEALLASNALIGRKRRMQE